MALNAAPWSQPCPAAVMVPVMVRTWVLHTALSVHHVLLGGQLECLWVLGGRLHQLCAASDPEGKEA